MSVLSKSLISVVQESNLLVDIIPVFPGIFSQSFSVHQPRFFHNFCNSEIPLSDFYSMWFSGRFCKISSDQTITGGAYATEY